MFGVADRVIRAPAWSRLLELRTKVFTAGREYLQLQLVSNEYVLTRIGRAAFIFFRDGSRRYEVDHTRRLLRPLDAGALRMAISDSGRARIAVSLQDGPMDMHGYACRRLSIESRSGLVTVSTESYYTILPGIERTPLHEERILSAPDGHPAHFLEAGEVLVSATTRVEQDGFEQVQTSRLWSVRGDPDDDTELEAIEYPRTNAVD